MCPLPLRAVVSLLLVTCDGTPPVGATARQDSDGMEVITGDPACNAVDDEECMT